MNGTDSARLDRLDFAAVPIWRGGLSPADDLNARLRAAILDERRADPQGVQKTNRGGWHSQRSLGGGSVFTEFHALVRAAYLDVIATLCWDVVELDVSLHMWANINPRGASNEMHTHPDCHLSGVYYVQTSEGCGNLEFIDLTSALGIGWEQQHEIRVTRATPMTATGLSLEPSDGLLVLFPSWLPHRVAVNHSDVDRISVAFNLSARPHGWSPTPEHDA